MPMHKRHKDIDAISAVQLGAGWTRRAIARSSRRIIQLLIVVGSGLLCLCFPRRGGIFLNTCGLFQCRGVRVGVVLIVLGSPTLAALGIRRPIDGGPRHLCDLDGVELLDAVAAVAVFRLLGMLACSIG